MQQYLGCVLQGGVPVGMCFQLVPGVLVTAWHVLDVAGVAAEGAQVKMEPAGGGEVFEGVVARLDQGCDLAVLTCEAHLQASAESLAATDEVSPHTVITATGLDVVDGSQPITRALTAVNGWWVGPAMWEDAKPAGRMTAQMLPPGMSGTPVIRDDDGAIVGVVSGRYNSVDGWLPEAVWVVRTEDLVSLLDGIADVVAARLPPTDPADLLLTVTTKQVRVTGPGVDVAAGHGGVRPGLAEAVDEVRRERIRRGPLAREALDRAARLMGKSFLPEQVADELDKALKAADRASQPIRLGLEVPAELAGLPWEALPCPDGTGPLALHPLVRMYRKTGATPTGTLPGPLRIVIAIAAPDTGGGPLLDYERELHNVLAAVRAARRDAADVRVVPFATPAAIRAALDKGPVHVLHISGHGSPGHLDLENEDGTVRSVTAEEFVEQAVPAGKMPLVITLSACYSDAAGRQGGTSFAGRLCQYGAAAVIATETSITDSYATRLLAQVYGTLAQVGDLDVVAALAEARRQVQAELETSSVPRDGLLAELCEWAAVTVLAAAGSVPVHSERPAGPSARQTVRPQVAGLTGRDWYFVGRRAEQRHWLTELTSPETAGVVICGIGGVGKTALADELIARVREQEPGRVLVSLAGQLTLESLLGAVITTIRHDLLASGDPGTAEVIRALEAAARTDKSWQDRLAILRSHVLDRVPMLVLLDNFEDNLRGAGAEYVVRDEVLGGLMAAWAADAGLSRLLITCRYQFTLPRGAERRLSFRQLGALSRAETMKLAWSLPALDGLDAAQLENVWRLAGGHPRSLEYLDALLSGGDARYSEVTARLSAALDRRLSMVEREMWLTAHARLDAALAEIATLAADDVLLGELLARLDQMPGAVDLLVGMSVFREPVDEQAVLFQAGQSDPDAPRIPDRASALMQITSILDAAEITVHDPLEVENLPASVREQLRPHFAELNLRPQPPYRPTPGLAERVSASQAASLLTVGQTSDGQPQFFVHRWTAAEMTRRATREADSRLHGSHKQAAAYWQWRVDVWPQDGAAKVHDLLEARYHLLQAGAAEDASEVSERAVSLLHDWGAWDQEASLIYDTLAHLPADSPSQATWIHQLGIIALDRGDFEQAARQYLRAREAFKRLGDEAGVANTYHQLGKISQARGDYAEAARRYRRSINLNKQIGNHSGMAKAYHQLGMLAHDRGVYAEADRHYRRSLNINKRLGDQATMAINYHELGRLAQDRGNYAEATRHYQSALDIKKGFGNKAGMANSYGQLGNLAYDRGEYAEAAQYYRRAVGIFERLGDQIGMASSYHQLGSVALRRGDHTEAGRQYQRAVNIYERLGDEPKMANTYGQLGVLAQQRGDYAEAARQHQRALRIAERLGGQPGIANSCHGLGLAAQAQGDYAEAARQYQRSLDINKRLGNQAGVANIYHQLGRLAYLQGDIDQAVRKYRHSLDINERLGNQVSMAYTYTALGMLEKGRDAPPATAITWHVRSMAIRHRLQIPQAADDVRNLTEYRRELGVEQFASLLDRVSGDHRFTEIITSLINQLHAGNNETKC